MCRNYKCAPLPFMGQKRYFIRDFFEVLKQVAGQIDTVVDLFGGSGLLSCTAKKVLPGCRVIYNDFDHYDRRLAAVDDTNAILTTIKQRLSGVQANQRLTQEQRADVLRIVEEAQNRLGWVDIMTIGRSVLFSGKWVTSLEELRKHTMYNRVRPGAYESASYLDELEVAVTDIPPYTKSEYDAKVAELVREKYTADEEFALQRKMINAVMPPDTISADGSASKALEEYQAYNTYVQGCKARAKDASLYILSAVKPTGL